jgi:hypothetical protein
MASYPSEPPLPPGWEARRDPASGRMVYIDHSTRTTSWYHPLQTQAAPSISAAAQQFFRGGGQPHPGPGYGAQPVTGSQAHYYPPTHYTNHTPAHLQATAAAQGQHQHPHPVHHHHAPHAHANLPTEAQNPPHHMAVPPPVARAPPARPVIPPHAQGAADALEAAGKEADAIEQASQADRSPLALRKSDVRKRMRACACVCARA